ncbi:MAG: NfeD family protein [Deltaproteobacteria bacterium]|nr:NfeD family protein [Deltaproteobacteria bacterium]
MAAYLVWFIIGLVFIVLEITMPNFVFIFFGVGAWAASAVAFSDTLGLEFQIVTFILASVLGLVSLRRLGLKAFTGRAKDTEDDGLDASPVGSKCLVTKPIAPDMPGSVKFRGSFWRAVAQESIEAGAMVVVEKIESNQEGTVYHVRPVTRG